MKKLTALVGEVFLIILLFLLFVLPFIAIDKLNSLQSNFSTIAQAWNK